MKNYSIRQGESLVLSITADDAVTATLTLVGQNELIKITKSASFTDGSADVSLEPEDTLVIDVYDYMVTVFYDNGVVAKFPDTDCDGEDCGFPTITICEALDVEESS